MTTEITHMTLHRPSAHASSTTDREQICDLLACYCESLDEYDVATMAACFAADATTDYGPGRGGLVSGREAIAQRIADGQAVFSHTHHQLGQIRVKLSGDAAQSLSYVTAWHERISGERDILCLRYLDSLRREGGHWLICARRIEVSWVDGFPGVQWPWVQRHGI
jgi:hypothetical protein